MSHFSSISFLKPSFDAVFANAYYKRTYMNTAHWSEGMTHHRHSVLTEPREPRPSSDMGEKVGLEAGEGASHRLL